MRSIWLNRFLTAAVWALAAAGLVYWALKFVRGVDVPNSASIAGLNSSIGVVDSAALAQALGANASKVNATKIGAVPAYSASENPQNNPLNAARFVLTGVVSGQSAAALLAVDGKAPRPYRVGAQIAPNVYLKSISPSKANLSTTRDGEIALSLKLPKAGQTASAGVAGVNYTPLPLTPPPAVAPPPMQPVTQGITSRSGLSKQRDIAQRESDPNALAPAVLQNNLNLQPPVVNPPVLN